MSPMLLSSARNLRVRCPSPFESYLRLTRCPASVRPSLAPQRPHSTIQKHNLLQPPFLPPQKLPSLYSSFPAAAEMTATPSAATSRPPRVALLAFSNHIWMKSTVWILKQQGIDISLLIEEDSETAAKRSDAWLNQMYDRSTSPHVSRNLRKIEHFSYKNEVDTSHVVKDMNSEAPRLLKEHGIDVIVLANCGIISPDVIGSAKHCLNAHPALLEGKDGIRGALPFARAIMLDRPIGVSLHSVEPEVDRGEILQLSRIPVMPEDGIGDIMYRILEEQASMFAGVLKQSEMPKSTMPNECKRRPYKWSDHVFEKAHEALRSGNYSHFTQEQVSM